MATSPPAQLYSVQLSSEQWDEIVSLLYVGDGLALDQHLTRSHWIAIAQMALGKAECINNGYYGGVFPDDLLRSIAAVILDKFRPGDGQI